MRIVEKKVISLEDSARTSQFLEQADASEFEVFRAFDARGGNGLEYLDDKKFRDSHKGYFPRPAEIGCAISHLKVIEEFSSKPGNPDDLLLVCEDDAYFTEDFNEVFNKIVESNVHFDYLILADAHGFESYQTVMNYPGLSSHLSLRSKIFKGKTRRCYRLGRFLGNPWGAGCYVISRKAATKYIGFWKSQPEGFWWFSDDYEIWPDKSDVDIKLVKPALARFDTIRTPEEDINLNFFETNKKNFGHLIEKSPKNYLKYFKLKLIMSLKATVLDYKNDK